MKEGKTQNRWQRNKPAGKHTYLEDFHNHFLIVGDVDGFKDFTVLAPAQFPHKLIVILVAVEETREIRDEEVAAGSKHSTACFRDNASPKGRSRSGGGVRLR